MRDSSFFCFIFCVILIFPISDKSRVVRAEDRPECFLQNIKIYPEAIFLLADNSHYVAGFDAMAIGNVDGLDGAGNGRADFVLHLHGFKQHEGVAFFHGVANLGIDLVTLPGIGAVTGVSPAAISNGAAAAVAGATANNCFENFWKRGNLSQPNIRWQFFNIWHITCLLKLIS